MTTEQEGVSPATAGGASAPDFNAIRDALADTFRGVPLWQLRQGLVAAGLIPADVEIRAVERKPVSGEPGIEAEWDEDADAMRIDGIGWDLSFGCKVSFAYDHDKGEHYVCVSTSDADQRAGITSRRTTKEQLASLGQQLVNVFGEPDPRDTEIERLRRLVGDENVPEGWGFLSRHDAIVRCEEAWQEHLKQRDQIEALTAERDQLRAELNDVVERHTVGLVALRQDFTAAVNGLMPKPEPRRWVKGEPEPEIGTTVRQSGDWGDGPAYTRRADGLWYRQDDQAAFSWANMTAYASDHPLVEVVSSDGD